MLRVGLTGGLGSGKSTVAGMFAALGAAVISADQLGRAADAARRAGLCGDRTDLWRWRGPPRWLA